MEFIGKNNLSLSNNPYLLQHVDNPVHWQMWSKEILQYAKENQLPLFISIGYSSCHWCHVMEEESFSDMESANILNEYFIPIKIDREERPDIDSYYINAAHLMGIQAGWPLNVFTDHLGSPFWICTYLPLQNAFNLKSFKEVVQYLGNLWRESPNKILSQTENNRKVLKDFFSKENPQSEIDEDNFMKNKEFIDLHLKYYDKEKGGFKFQSKVKFPSLLNLLTLLKISQYEKNTSLLDLIEHSTLSMIRGGIYDHLGGGLFRYSTDYDWEIPHFEKMLYDNALLIELLVDLCRASQKKEHLHIYQKIILETINYWLEEMMEGGVFYSSQDAGGKEDEGEYYVWTMDEINHLLNQDEKEDFYYKYRLINFSSKKDKYLLAIKTDFDFSINNDSTKKINKIEQKLFRHRQQRQAPFKDKKILVSWNCLMAYSLAHAHEILPQFNYLEKAQTILDFIRNNMLEGEFLIHSVSIPISNNKLKNKVYGFLQDYGNWARACLKVYCFTNQTKWLDLAKQSVDVVIDNFEVGEVFSEISHLHQDSLVEKMVEAHDGVEPSGLSLLADNFMKLNLLSPESKYHEKMVNIFKGFYEYIGSNSLPFMLSVFHDYQVRPKLITIFGDIKDKLKVKMIEYLYQQYLNSMLVCSVNSNKTNQVNKIIQNSLANHQSHLKTNKTFAIVCQDQSCSLPIEDMASLEVAIKSK